MKTKLPDIGKISPEVFNELIFPRLGAVNKNILVGPQHGVDVGIVEIGTQAVAITTDPVFIVPAYGWERAAWFAAHILISDVVTSGLPPVYMAIDLNLPMEINEEEIQIMWETIHKECKKFGISVICGHTARYENCNYPMVGGATVLAIGDKDKYVTPKMAKEKDKIIITKGPAIEACGIFAAMFPKLLEKEFGSEFSKQSQELFYKMSVVKEAMAAVKVGVRDEGISSMHDATECGIWGGLYELAQASGLGIRVEKELIPVENNVKEICDYFKIDPYKSISEGTLIVSCRPHKAQEVVNVLSKEGIKSAIVGELTNAKEKIILRENGKDRELEHPRVDPFWQAFYDAMKKH
ncbi:MAG: AIR synthase family protein [bacterium]|nr:AIR synthase family protein [bacterium]